MTHEGPELLDPQLDVVFRLLLLRHPTLLRSMIEGVLGEPIAGFTVLDRELPSDAPAGKAIVVDILVELADGRRINVEMQVRVRPELRPRLAFYAARNLSQQLARGGNYEHVRPSIVVVWLAEPLFPALDQFHSVFELRERRTQIRYGEELTLHLLQLSKLPAFQASSATSHYEELTTLWGRFLSAKSRLEFQRLKVQDPIMSQAVDALEDLSRDPEALRLAEKRRIDQKFYEMGLAMAREEATREGRREGIQQGMQQGIASILRRLLEQKFGPMDAQADERLRLASLEELERWSKRVLAAAALGEVFED